MESLNLDEDPNLHISMFLQLCNTLKDKGVSKDAIQLRLFPSSVKGKAQKWLKAQRLGNITTWEQLNQRFFNQYFLATRYFQLKDGIKRFAQQEEETLRDAWERFKELLSKCPSHRINEWEQVQIFHNGLTPFM